MLNPNFTKQFEKDMKRTRLNQKGIAKIREARKSGKADFPEWLIEEMQNAKTDVEELARIKKRLFKECSKLDPEFEQAMAEEGFAWELDEWDEFCSGASAQ